MQTTILLIEDSPEDRMATVRAFKRTGFQHSIVDCMDGDEALDYLYRRGRFAAPGSAPRPNLILLDLNLPGTGGHEVLEQVKADEQLCKIPVVVLTTSADPHDIDASYRAGANSYIQKPMDRETLYDTALQLKTYWFDTVVLPD